MAAALHEVPSRIRTVRDMIRAFADERRRRALLARPTGMTPVGEIRARVVRSGDDIADRPRRTRQGGIAAEATVGAFVHP